MATKPSAPKILSVAQQKQFMRVVNALNTAQGNHDKAQAIADATGQALGAAQAQANNFVAYCAEEMGVTLGADGWTFNQGRMAFEQVLPSNGNGAETE